MKTTIALMALAFSMATASASEYSCFGTEPFWGAKITDTQISVDNFETTTTAPITYRETAAGVGDEYAFVVKSEKLSASIITGECSDGMSENVYTHHVILEGADSYSRPFYGCCNKVK
jgi:uncharacterized membrane protein